MAVLVVDASAFIEMALQSRAGREVQRSLADSTLAVPAHFDAEVLSALGRLHRAGEIDEERVAVGLRQLARAPMRRYPLQELVQDAWDSRPNLSLRDALYVVLAQRLDATLVTTDARLARAPNLPISLRVVQRTAGNSP